MIRIGITALAVLAVLGMSSAQAEVTVKIKPEAWFGDEKCKISLGLESEAPVTDALVSILMSGGNRALCSVWSLSAGTQWDCNPSTIEAPCATISEATVENVACGGENGAPTSCGKVQVAAPEAVATQVAPDAGKPGGATIWIVAAKNALLFDKPFGCELVVGRAFPAPDRGSEIAFDLTVFAKGAKAKTCNYTASGLSTNGGCNVKMSEYTCPEVDRVEVTSVACRGADGAKKSCGDVQVKGVGLDARMK